MIKVDRMPELTYSNPPPPIYTTDINSNMIGAPLVSDSRATKKSSSGKLMDNETLLVILSTVLNTQTSKSEKISPQSITQSEQRTHTEGTKSHGMPRQAAAAELDFKIEKAMDSVKMELLLTVRKEVRQLQSQVELLQVHNRYLEQENRILRSAAAPETLAKLSRDPTSPLTHTSCAST